MKHAIPNCIILFLPRRSDKEPKGIDNRTMVNPVDDAKAPMRETEAPRLRAKKG